MATAQKQDIDLGITRYEWGKLDRKQVAVLQIETSKHYNGGLESDATVYWVGNRIRSTCMSIGGTGDGDFRKGVAIVRNVKATQKAIDRQHAGVFTPEVVAQLMEGAKLHYAKAIQAG